MPVKYIPLVPWQQVAEAEWDKPGFEISRATILFRGPRTTLAAAESKIADFETMPGFGTMRMERWQAKNITPSFPGIEKIYVGFRNGVPTPKPTSGISAQTARLSGVDNTSGQKVSATVTYRASRTTWEYWSISRPPLSPIYQQVIYPVNPITTIDSFQFETQDGNTTVPLSSITAIINAAVPEFIVSDYTTEMIIPNAIWHCTSTVDYRLRSS